MSNNSARGSAWNLLRQQVLIRDDYRCTYCGNEGTEADHVIPRSKGGTDTIDNLVAACRSCNGSKQARIEMRMPYFDKSWLEHL